MFRHGLYVNNNDGTLGIENLESIVSKKPIKKISFREQAFFIKRKKPIIFDGIDGYIGTDLDNNQRIFSCLIHHQFGGLHMLDHIYHFC